MSNTDKLTWTTADGRVVLIKDLSPEHLKNIMIHARLRAELSKLRRAVDLSLYLHMNTDEVIAVMSEPTDQCVAKMGMNPTWDLLLKREQELFGSAQTWEDL